MLRGTSGHEQFQGAQVATREQLPRSLLVPLHDSRCSRSRRLLEVLQVKDRFSFR